MENINESNFMVNQPLLMGAIDKILLKRSIAKRVSDIQMLHGPLGIITGAEWDKVNGTLRLAKSDIEAFTRKIRTEFTIEALEDLNSIYRESFYDILAHYLVDELVYSIDSDFISLVKTRATTKATLNFDNTFDKDLWSVGQTIAITVNKGLSDLPISDNRSPNGWAIVSSNVASILSLTTNLTEGDSNDDSPSYMGRLAGVDYYIDYTFDNSLSEDAVVFGIKGNGYSKGSTIYSHYTQDWIDTIDPSTGENIFFLLDRTTMSINPLDSKYYDGGAGTSAFLGKFNVGFGNMSVFV